MRRLLRCGVLGLAMSALALGCSSNRSANGDIDEPTGMFIDEPIILTLSGPTAPSEQTEREFTFDLSGDTLVQAGRCNDFFVSYAAGRGDIGAEVWDNDANEWVRFGPKEEGSPCQWGCAHLHMLSMLGVNTRGVLDGASRLRVRFAQDIHPPRVWTLEVNPDFAMIPDDPEIPFTRWGLAFGGDAYYFISRRIGPDDHARPAVFKEELTGATHFLFDVSSYYSPSDLAFDGEYWWVTCPEDTVFKLNADGDVLCTFTAPITYQGRLTWAGTSLWLTGFEDAEYVLHEIDTEASCARGSAVVIRTIPRYGDGCNGLTWDGSRFLIAGDLLYQVWPDGKVDDAYNLPVTKVEGIAWDGSRVCILSHGPPGPGGRYINEMPIACFRLR